MTRKLTAWLTTDGYQEVVVAAPSKTAAARAMERSLYSFDLYASDLDDGHPTAVFAFASPGIAFTRSNRHAWSSGKEGWEPKGGERV